MDADTLDLLRGSVRAVLGAGPEHLQTGLDELGWDDVLDEDEAAAINLLFVEQGRTAIGSRTLDAVVSRAIGLESGDAVGMVYPLGDPSPRSRSERGAVIIDGVVLGKSDSGSLLVPTVVDGSTRILLVEPTQNIEYRQVSGFDPSSGIVAVRGVVPEDATTDTSSDWAVIESVVRRALASELVGTGRAMIDIATRQISDRKQFGRPIGANQSPRHRLAEAHVAVSAAENLIELAWSDATPWASATAKAFAGSALDTTSRACLQVCGAIGLTFEHPLSGYVRRSTLLDAMGGTWSALSDELGSAIRSTQSVPSVGAL